MFTCRCRDQIIDWCARARTLTASARSLSPATGRWLCRSVRTRSASTFASPGIGLRARGRVPVPVTRRRHRVHREHLIARRDQRGDEQAPVGLDPDHHLARIVGVPRRPAHGTGRSPPRPRAAGPRPAACRPRPRRARRDGLPPSPLPQRSSGSSRRSGTKPSSPEESSSSLMDQCSRHDIPPAITGDLTSRQGHDLDLGLKARAAAVLTCWRRQLGLILAPLLSKRVARHRHRARGGDWAPGSRPACGVRPGCPTGSTGGPWP